MSALRDMNPDASENSAEMENVMKKNVSSKTGKMEKEHRKKHFFNRDDDMEEEYDYDEIDDDEDDDDEDDADDEDDDDEDDAEDDNDDDDDEDDDDEDDDDEDDDGEWNNEAVRRMRRRKRRIRNQILAYAVIVFLAAGIIGGSFLGVRTIVRNYQAKKQSEELAAKLKELEELAEPEPVVDMESEAFGEEDGQTVELSPLDEIANARIAEMPLEDKVAGLFMVTPEQLTGVSGVTQAGETTKNALMEYKVGGLVYTDSNITDSEQLKKLLTNTALIDQTLFLAVNEEGGEKSVVASKLSLAEVPDAETIGAGGNTDSAYQAGSDIGAYLAEFGFNLNLAPVADVKIAEDSILGSRSFGADASVNGELAACFVRGLNEKGISACVKTFPGLGSVTEVSEEGIVDIQRSRSDMENSEFQAYQMAIDGGSEFMMAGSISAPELTGDNTPCCFSSTAIGIIRETLGFDGIIITGALDGPAIKDYYTSAEVGEKALKAGADMIYMPENFKEAYEGLLKAVQEGTVEESRIDESLLRIYRVKYKDRVDAAESTEDNTEGAEPDDEQGNGVEGD